LAAAAALAAGQREGTVELLGPLSQDQILNKCVDWQEVAAAYNPNAEFIDKLRSISTEVKVEVFLGTWCPDSKAHVGEYFKVLELADNPLIQTIFIGVPRDKAKRAPYYQGKDIERLPTFVVYIDSREKGRIVEVPTKSVEEDLVEILSRSFPISVPGSARPPRGR
jgi:thiol-disulfide isomerase/thioredoxin